MEEVARIVLALEATNVAEEVMHFLDRTGRVRVVGTAVDGMQLADAVRQLEPDAVVASPSLVGARDALNGSALIAVDTTQSVGTLRRAIRAGAVGFYLWPAEREDLALAAARVRPPAGETLGERAPVLAVYGPRGGAGTTFVATHLAAAFARRGTRCVLVDLDTDFGDASAALGLPDDASVKTVADLRALGDEVAARHLEDVVWRHPVGFDVLLAPADGSSIDGEDYRRAISAARGTCDVVVLHLPRALGGVAKAGFQVADLVLLVMGLDVLSFRDAKRAIETVGLDGRCAFVVNRPSRSEIAPSDVRRVFGRSPIAVIPSSGALRSAQDHGRLLPLRGRVGRAMDRLALAALEGIAS